MPSLATAAWRDSVALLLRPLAVIVALIGYSAPGLPHVAKVRYARVIQKQAHKRHFDPATYVALVEHESHWRAGTESADGEDIGLGAIRARYVSACRRDPQPVKSPGKACLAVRESLRNGEHNIRVMARTLSSKRKWCKQRTGTAWIWQTIGAYGGLGCRHKARKHKGVMWIVNRRKQLLRRLSRDRKRARASATR